MSQEFIQQGFEQLPSVITGCSAAAQDCDIKSVISTRIRGHNDLKRV